MKNVEVQSGDVLKFADGVHKVKVVVPRSNGRMFIELSIDHRGRFCVDAEIPLIGEIIYRMNEKVRSENTEWKGDKL